MAEKYSGNDQERCIFPCPLCEVHTTSVGHLTEHLKKFHRPLAELGPLSKRDDRLRLSAKQKELLTKAVPKNRYKSRERKYSLIVNIVAPRSPMAADNVLPQLSEEDIKSPTSASRQRNLQEYFRSHTENTLNIFRSLKGRDKEEFVRHHEYLLLTLRTTATDVEVATGAESHPVPAITVSQPTLAYPTPMLDPSITGLVVHQALFRSSSDQNFVAPDPGDEWQSPERLDYEQQG